MLLPGAALWVGWSVLRLCEKVTLTRIQEYLLILWNNSWIVVTVLTVGTVVELVTVATVTTVVTVVAVVTIVTVVTVCDRIKLVRYIIWTNKKLKEKMYNKKNV